MIRFGNAISWGMALALAVAPTAQAQTTPPAANAETTNAAATGDAPEQAEVPTTFKDLRRVFRAATTDDERNSALAALTTLATEGNLEAAQFLATQYRSAGGPIAPDPVKARQFLERAAELGDSSALASIGKMLRASTDPADKLSALDYLQRAYDAGETSIAFDLAQIYRTGSLGNAVDMPKAVDLYEPLAEAGDADSIKQLYALYRPGGPDEDAAKALTYLTMMAEAGDVTALEKLAATYLSGQGAATDLAKAEAYYRRAVDMGSSDAALNLAKGLLGGSFGAGRQADGVALLQAELDKNTTGVAVPLANAYFAGTGVAASPSAALDTLKTAADFDDLNAQTVLLGIYVRGRGSDIRPDLAAARMLRAKIAAEDATPTIQTYGVAIEAADGTGFADVFTAFDKLDAKSKITAGKLLRNTNPNAYIYVLQSELVARGLFDQAPNGMLTPGTIAAINSFCADAGITPDCRFGPLDRRSWDAISAALFVQ
ncbi:MAG: tetratricopeptide repeat protein [Cypionkella sp.]